LRFAAESEDRYSYRRVLDSRTTLPKFLSVADMRKWIEQAGRVTGWKWECRLATTYRLNFGARLISSVVRLTTLRFLAPAL